MKKLLLTTALMLCTVMANATAIFNGNGQGTQSSPYEIWNLDRLNEVRNFVGDESSGVYFRLEKDLDLTEYLEGLSWEAIGTSTEPFKGVFLGNGKKITGMIINVSADYQGFFGCISGATIQDLTIEGTVSGGSYVGGIVGSSTGTNTIQNCIFNGSVTGTGEYVGGIAGSFNGSMTNITHTGNTQGAGYVGGIVGSQTGNAITTATNIGNITSTNKNNGGIAGVANVVTSSNSQGIVSGKQYTGGLIGQAVGKVSSSHADGNVTGTQDTGGLIGRSKGTVNNCTSKGVVSGSQYTGGLIGYGEKTISNSRHTGGKVSGTNNTGGLVGLCFGSVSNSCHSGGNVSGGSNNYVGGLIGQLSSGSVTSCYSYANVTGNDNVGGIVGYYKLENGSPVQIASSGFFGNINARQNVGGIIGQIDYISAGTLVTTNPTKPTLHTYITYGSSASYDKTYQETWTEYDNTVSITNCAAVGDVIGTGTYTGGILGKGCGGKYYNSVEHQFNTTHYDINHKYNYAYHYYYIDGGTQWYESSDPVSYFTYTLSETSVSLTDNYFSGNLMGTDYLGGVSGYMHGGTISRNYSYAAIEGSNKVGGIVGYMQADLNNITTMLSSNVTLNSTVIATADAGKVYGYKTGSYLTIATSGNSINKTLNTTNLIVNGVTLTTSNSAQHGTLQTQRQLTQSTAYSGLGWNFNSGAEWTSEESVSYPYKQWQTAPPTIKTGAVKNSTTLTGTCVDDGTVYVTIEGNGTVYEATCSGGNWTLTVPALKSGTLIRAWSKNANKEQSYHTATTVSFLGSGTENDPWLIYDAYDLSGVAKVGYYKMMNNVDLTSWISANSSSAGWPGVGSNGTGSIIFDGNNKKVTGLWCNATTSQNGLFTYLENATIKDLTVEVASGKQMKGGLNTAILAGWLKNSTVTNVTVKGSVSGTDNPAALIGLSDGSTISGCKVDGCTINSPTAESHVGGMVASSYNDNISNCTVNATVTTTGTTYSGSDAPWRGGVVAYLQCGTMTDCSFNGTVTSSDDKARIGAIAGMAYLSSLTRCQANATVTATGADAYAGGLVSFCYDNSSVTQCFAEGSITASGTNTRAAGLVGYTNATCSVDNSMSMANVTGTGYVGGIVGYAKGSINKCVATGSLLNTSNDGRAGGIVGFIEGSAAIIKGCGGLNKRIETGSNQWGWRIIGGIGNDITRPEISDNYGWDEMPILRNNALKNVEDDPWEGTPKTTAELQQQSTYEAMEWDFSEIWTMSSETHLPILQWLATSAVTKGDLDGNGSVSITDVVLIIDVIAGTITDADKLAAADVNDDGNVTITDCVAAIDLIAAQTSSTRMAKAPAMRSNSDFISGVLQNNVLTVALDNERSYTAFQMVVNMPDGMTLGRATMDEMRGADHSVVVRDLGNGQYLVVGFSADNDELTGNTGRLLSIVTNGHSTSDIVISNVEFATTQAEAYHLAGLAINATTGLSDVRVNADDRELFFDLQGRRVATPAKGLYIVNGKKVNIK